MGDNPRLTVHDADARPFLRSTDTRYDLIVVDAYRQPYVPVLPRDPRVLPARPRPPARPAAIVALNVAAVPDDKRLVEAVGGTLAADFPQVLAWPALRFNTFVLGFTQPLSQGGAPRAASRAARPLSRRSAKLLARDATPMAVARPAVDRRPRAGRVARPTA